VLALSAQLTAAVLGSIRVPAVPGLRQPDLWIDFQLRRSIPTIMRVMRGNWRLAGGSRFLGCSRRSSSSAKSSSTNESDQRLRAFRGIVQERHSARRFEPNVAVPDHVWLDILRMTSTSPSGFNLQPWNAILLRDPEIRGRVAKHSMLGFGNQYRAVDASAILVFCSDLEPSKRVDRIYDLERQAGMREDGYMAVLRVASSFLTGESSTASLHSSGGGSSTHLSTMLKKTFTDVLSPVQPMPTMENVESWSYKNVGIAAQMYTLAATAHGLSTCMMEGYDARRLKEILRIPDRYGAPLVVATGYEYDAPPVVHELVEEQDEVEEISKRRRTPRLDLSDVFFGDTFGEPLDILLKDRDLVEDTAA